MKRKVKPTSGRAAEGLGPVSVERSRRLDVRKLVRTKLDIGYLPGSGEEEVRATIVGHIEHATRTGMIPADLVPLVVDILAARFGAAGGWPAEIVRTSYGLGEEGMDRILEYTEPTRWSTFIPTGSRSVLVDLSNGRYLAPFSDVLFQADATGTVLRSEASVGDFIAENKETLAIEMLIEVLGLFFILVPGGKGLKEGVKETVGEIAKTASRNRKVLEALTEFLEAILNHGWRGEKAIERLRVALRKLIEALTGEGFGERLLQDILKGLSGWTIFWMLLDLLLIFTPLGWGRKVAEILVWVGGMGYHLYHKYETWHQSKEHRAGGETQ